MQRPRSTRRSRLVRHLLIVVVVALGAGIFASPAVAGQPVKSTSTFTLNNTVADICSFPVTQDGTITATEIDFFDASGALTRLFSHQVEQDTFTANGKTLVGIPFTFNFEVLFDSSGNMTHVWADGVVEKIPLPDGSLFISAGRVDFLAHPGAGFILSPDKGNPGNIAGFCAALAP